MTKRSAALEPGVQDETYQLQDFTLEDGTSNSQQKADLLRNDKQVLQRDYLQQTGLTAYSADRLIVVGPPQEFGFDWTLRQSKLSPYAIDEHDRATALRYLREAAHPGPVIQLLL